MIRPGQSPETVFGENNNLPFADVGKWLITDKEMNDILFKKIKRANSKYSEYLLACDKVAKEAQKHINWNNNVGCAYMPGDGLCIEIEAHVCPATRFFELPEIIGNDMIDEYTYRISCI